MNVYNKEKLIKSGFVQQTIKELLLAVKKVNDFPGWGRENSV
jgi:hypothetical protein